MDRFLLLVFLIYPLLAYTAGVISAKKDFFSVEFAKRSWPDLLYFLFVVLISIWIVETFWQRDAQNAVQILIFTVTAAALIYQGFVAKTFRNYINRPIIDVEFDINKSDYYHMTLMRYGIEDKTGKKAAIEYFPSYYIRLGVRNIGKNTLKNVEVVLERVKPKQDIFMSLNLSWAGFIIPQGDIKRTVNIPQGQSRVVDVIEVTESSQTTAFHDRLEREGSWNEEGLKRLKKLASGFRSCTIKPNTLSDIFPAGEYTLYLGIYADNTKPKFIKFSIDYKGIWGTEGIKGMHSKYLKVKLLD